MKNIILTAAITFVSTYAGFAQQQNDKPASSTTKVPKEEGFEMKQYFFVMLIKGENRSHDSTTAANIQKGHMDNINRLAKEGKIVLAGPFGDDGNGRGIFIFDSKTKEEVIEQLKTDPAISSGRLAYEVRPWWTAKNCLFK